jgi:small subunit ribosomal protein S3
LKVTGARSRVEKFNRGYIKHNGEPAQSVVDRGQGVAVMKLGTIGVDVKIIPPGAELPDDFSIEEDAEVEAVEQASPEGGVEDLLEEPDEVPDVGEPGDESEPASSPDEVIDEEVVEEVVEQTDEQPVATGEPVDTPDEASIEDDLDQLDDDVESEAADLIAEMEDDSDDGGA